MQSVGVFDNTDNAKWTDPVGRNLWAILTCIHAGLRDGKP